VVGLALVHVWQTAALRRQVSRLKSVLEEIQYEQTRMGRL
jgi:hypothetical protein